MSEGLESFGISIGAGIVIEGAKFFVNQEVQSQINKAFEESLFEFCGKNASILEIERANLKDVIKRSSELATADLRNYQIAGDYSKFFGIFETKLAKQNAAYNYLKEIRDEARFQEIRSQIKSAIETLKDEINKSNSYELGSEYNRQIEQYKSNLQLFKPRTAYANLIALERSFEGYEFNPSVVMKSSLESLKGQCLEYMASDHKKEWQKAYIRAYKLNSNSRENLENACYANYRLDQFVESEQLADKILELDPFNSKAWAVKCLLLNNESLCDVLSIVPEVVVVDLKFKSIIHVRSIEKGTYSDLAQAFSIYNILIDVSEFDSSPTTYENLNERGYLVRCAVSKIQQAYINFNHLNQISVDKLTPILELLKSYFAAVEFSELELDRNQLNFIISYVEFLIDNKKDSVYRMKEFWSKSKAIQQYDSLVLANSLQLIGNTEDAIEIIEKTKIKSSELLALQLVCYSKLNDLENFVSTSKLFLLDISDVTFHLVHIFGIIETLNNSNMNFRLSIDEYLENKRYPTHEIGELIREILKVYRSEVDSQTLEKLNAIWESGKVNEDYMQAALANTYSTLKEYSKSIQVYKAFINYDRASTYLLRYINTLHLSKSNNLELLRMLKNWRENFFFHPTIFQLEVDLKRQLFDWDEIIAICEQYLENDESNDFIIANYAMAINEIDKATNDLFERLFVLLKNVDFQNYNNVKIVGTVLMQNRYHLEGLELFYKYAIDESNSQARMDYFMACVKCPEGTLKDFSTIEEGHFIKFENKGNISFAEVSSKNKNFQELIGKHVGDKIMFSSEMLKSDKSIVIIRIMNKYLCLHDQILNEVDNKDPFSQMPMESFDLSHYIENGNIMDFFAELAGPQNFDPEKLINEYYSGELTFSELVVHEYSNHFIRAYYNLVYDRKGLVQYSLSSYPEIDLTDYSYFILDFASLLCIFELERTKSIKFTKKFIVTKSTKSMIRAFSKDIIGHSGNQYVLGADFYQELLSWVEKNCEIKMATSRLDLVQAIPMENRGNTVVELLVDNIALVQELDKSLLITDDSMVLRFFPLNSGRVIGVSTFNIKSIICRFLYKESE